MLKTLPLLFVLGLASPAAADHLFTPPAVMHPLPQGVPTFHVGMKPHPVSTLRFGLINGRRALVYAETGHVYAYLNP